MKKLIQSTTQIKAEAAALLAQAEAQQRVNGSLGEYLKALERIEKLRKTILESTEAENKLQAEVNTAVGQAKITSEET
jgi:regulator of protease activity HflC (stomatin/prohibitin superfamily)